MKRLVTLGLAVMIALTALATSSPTDAHGQTAGLASSVLNRLQRNHENLRSLRASISMEKYNAQLRDAETFYGAVVYVPKGERDVAVRIDWSKPQHEILAVANGRYTLFRPRLGVAYTGDAKSSKASGDVLDLMNMSGSQVKQKFQPLQDVREETLWGGVSTIHLKLVPASKGGASYKYAEIWVDATGMPIQFKVVEKNDDASTVRLNNLEKNAKISADEFMLKLDPNVKIIRG